MFSVSSSADSMVNVSSLSFNQSSVTAGSMTSVTTMSPNRDVLSASVPSLPLPAPLSVIQQCAGLAAARQDECNTGIAWGY